MARPKLTLAVADHDLNRPLIDGSVRPQGLELEIVHGTDDGARHAAMLREGAFDASEFSLASYLVARSRGDPFVAIPVFPNRKFRHSYIFCNAAAGICEPRDLEGRRVGMRMWGATACVWVRGTLQHFYEVDLTRVTWCVASEPGGPLPDGTRLERLPPHADLDAMLVAGQLDAVVNPDVLPSIIRGAAEVCRLFPDYKAEEQAFYRRTGIFPISHLVVLKDQVVRQHPQAPLILLDAFRRARDECFRRIEEQQILSISWASALLDDQRGLMGRHYWPYNVADNRKVLETLVGFAHEQRLISDPLAIEDLFVEETLTASGA